MQPTVDLARVIQDLVAAGDMDVFAAMRTERRKLLAQMILSGSSYVTETRIRGRAADGAQGPRHTYMTLPMPILIARR